ncbi:MAG: glycine cleavage system aminomethyltransferase GcvT [Planctomycetota bacterium]|nr:glycine cleavage system aminomethyltransferase GcvT [Planctomycetota bacterium]
MTTALAQTPLHEWHVAQGGRMVEFGGWSMPIQYGSIVDEHRATRRAVGLFDISHMGRLRFDGDNAGQFLDTLVTRRVDNLMPGRIRYGVVCNDDGGCLDDVLVYRLDGHRGPYHLMVVNASNREKIVRWIDRHIDGFGDVQFEDATSERAMIAVQGPQALGLVKPLLDFDPAELKYYTGRESKIGSADVIVSRTGYTGEDGCELIVPAEFATELWQSLLDAGSAVGATPVGLAARDTLRLEAAMPLYGHELSEEITPVQAGLGFAIDIEDREFHGRDALIRVQRDPDLPRRVGLECPGRRVPREQYLILSEDREVGYVTSGTFSPTFEKPIAMGYVAVEASHPGTELSIQVRGRGEPARVVELPFYKRK